MLLKQITRSVLVPLTSQDRQGSSAYDMSHPSNDLVQVIGQYPTTPNSAPQIRVQVWEDEINFVSKADGKPVTVCY